MKLLVLGNKSIINTLILNGYEVTNDPIEEVSAIIADSTAFKYAPEGNLFITLTGTMFDLVAKKTKPNATFVSTEAELLEKLKLIPPPQKAPQEIIQDSILVVTYANKGGVGKTSSAIALATTYASMGVKTVLCDFDLSGPNIGNFFKIPPAPNWFQGKPKLAKASENLMVLTAPSITDAYSIKPYQIESLIGGLKKDFSIVVCDTCPEPWDKSYIHPLFAYSDIVYSIVDQSTFSLDETAKYAPSLVAMGVAVENIRIIVNRYDPKLTSLKQIEKSFCSGFKKEARNLPKIMGVIPEGWQDQVNAGFRGKILHQEEWTKVAEEGIRRVGKTPVMEEAKHGIIEKLLNFRK